MFDKKEPAEAQILADEGGGHVIDTDMHGVDWDHHKYILEVRPAGEAAFRVETKAKVAIFHAPQSGPEAHPCEQEAAAGRRGSGLAERGAGSRGDRSVAEHPRCDYCLKPLPCKPVPEDY